MSQNDTFGSSAGDKPQEGSQNAQNDGGENPQGSSAQEAHDFSTPEGMAAAFDQLDSEQLADVLADRDEAPDHEEPTPEPEATKEETPEGYEKGEEDPEKATSPDRIRLKGLPERDKLQFSTAISAVKAGTYESIEEAYSDLYGKPLTKAPEAKAAEEESQTEETPDATPEPLQAIDDEINDLKQQRKDARAEFDNDRADELADLIHDKQLERNQVKASLADSAKADDAYHSSFKNTVTQLHAENEDLADPESPLYGRLAELRDLEEFRAQKGIPESVKLMEDPKFLKTLVERAKKDLGMTGGNTVPPAPSVNPGQRRGTVSPATASQGSMSTDAALSMLSNMSEEDLLQAGEQLFS